MSKYVAITGFLLCIQIAIAMVNATALFDYQPQYSEEWLNTAHGFFNDYPSDTQSPVQVSGWDAFWLNVKALSLFITAWFFGIIVLPYTLGGIFMLPYPIYWLASIPIYMSYILVIVELKTKKDMD